MPQCMTEARREHFSRLVAGFPFVLLVLDPPPPLVMSPIPDISPDWDSPAAAELDVA